LASLVWRSAPLLTLSDERLTVSHITYAEAAVVGLIQGVTELFPVSSLGHNVLIPALIGGSWASDLNVAAPESPYLAFIVGLHVATAIALLIYFWRDWVRIIAGFFQSFRQFLRPAPGTRRYQLQTTDQKLAWMLIFATIPVGLVGLVGEHEFRVLFGKPVRAAIFLVVNGAILWAGERFRTRKSLQADADLAAQRAGVQLTEQHEQVTANAGTANAGTAGGGTASGARPPAHVAAHASGHHAVRQAEIAGAEQADERLAAMGYVEAVIIGAAQILALLAGISRDGVTMVAGMFRGLSREDAARFAFLLATPVILAAGVLKIGDLTGPLGKGIHGQILLGSILSGVGAYVSVRFLVKYFQTRTLTPFAVYCVLFGLGSIIYLQVK
jgi:undecaprenyl-diphosphatase